MNRGQIGLAAAATLVLFIPASSGASAKIADPLRFFEGRTETVSTVKVFTKKPFRSRATGRGRMLSDRSLDLVQRVEDEGQPPRERRWKIRQTGPGRFVGTMSEAVGPVTIDETPKGYRFRFKLKDHMAVEQLLTPIGSGRAARTVTTVRKLGLKVAKSEGIVRKLD